ncbi:hypothetical protein Tco_0848806, partial [Tanacetum coccineum]
VKKLHGYGHLEEVGVKRADRQLCKFKKGDLVDLHLNDIEDMLLLVVQHKLFHLNKSDIVDFIVALRVEELKRNVKIKGEKKEAILTLRQKPGGVVGGGDVDKWRGGDVESRVSATKDPFTFNDLIATLIDFSKYVLNQLNIDNLTQDLLLGPAYNLLKGTCTSSIKLKYNFQECFNALTNKFDWNNPEGDRYPFDLSKPLPLQGRPGHLSVAADYFFNNDLEFLKTFDPEKTYTMAITKTKATRYEIVGIEDMTHTLWSTIKHAYDKDAEKGIKH